MWRRQALFVAERFQAKHALGLDPGWRPVRIKKTRQINNPEPRFDSIETERLRATDRIAMRHLLRLVVRGDTDRLVVVGRIEFGAIAAPGLVLQYAVDLAKPGRRKPQRDHLSDPHHHIPADHLDAGRGERLCKNLASRAAR